MDIVIIGSGNVATVLGRLCVQKGHKVVQVISRNATHAKVLADELGCSFAGFDGKLNKSAGLYLMAISDTGLFELNMNFKLDNQLVLHTAGAVSKDVLQGISRNYGVLYPLQSLRKEMSCREPIPFLIDGNTVDAVTLAEDFAKTLSFEVNKANDDQRLKLHVAAVIVSNFTNHLYALAESYCKKESVDFSLLTPLILETAERITAFSPATVQTGPAMRNDMFTIEKHLQVLQGHAQLSDLYTRLTESILQV